MPDVKTTQVEMSSQGYRLKGQLHDPGGGGPLVVLCHGIPLSRPEPSDPGYPALARDLAGAGHASLFVNLRGTGESGGDFCLGGWYEDLVAVMGYALDIAHAHGGLFMAGFSAGAALAIRYAAEHGGVDGVAAFAAPARLTEVFPRDYCHSFLEVAREVGIIREPRFPPTPDWFYDDLEKNDALEYVSRVSPVPLLIAHGDDDDTVPVAQARELFDAAGEPKELRILPGGGHRLRRDPRVLDCLVDWLERLGGPRSGGAG